MFCRARALCCAFAAVTLLLNLSPACTAADHGFATVGGNVKPTTDVDMGEFTSPHMSVEVVLAPRDASGLSSLLADLYQANATGQNWLSKGEFYSRFAPDPAQAAAVADYLRQSGLDVEQTSSPFLLRVSAPSSMMESTFRTALHNYRNRNNV
ncbi:MAG TPA: protease pro-enzyme activation domain-containing protein, partial [Bryobacteraceae bacterium]|nr:protease pro-enzyme activation domain-containing protein [Bryobacteraceae bacterium]